MLEPQPPNLNRVASPNLHRKRRDQSTLELRLNFHEPHLYHKHVKILHLLILTPTEI